MANIPILMLLSTCRCATRQLAYAHAVQLLVDVFLLLTPFALYSEVGFWSIVATGVLTTFYQARFWRMVPTGSATVV